MANTAFIYETTNIVNGRKYIGSHVGEVDDKYLGSGVEFLKDLKVHGAKNFQRAILEVVDNPRLIAKIEAKWLLAVDAKNNPAYYNRTNTGGSRYRKPTQKERGMCPSCTITPVAVNYHRDGVTYYRDRCDQCYRKKRKPKPAGWIRSGYKKKDKCEKCGFKLKHIDQSLVYHVDGNVDNNDWLNLKTICANCSIEISNAKERWKPSKLRPDF